MVSIRSRAWVVGLVLVLVGSVAMSGCGEVPSGASSADTPESTSTPTPPEYQLAQIDEGFAPDAGDPVTEKFATALSSMYVKCNLSRQYLAYMTISTQGEMQKGGANESLLSILSRVDASILDKDAGTVDCPYLFAFYATMRIKGQ